MASKANETGDWTPSPAAAHLEHAADEEARKHVIVAAEMHADFHKIVFAHTGHDMRLGVGRVRRIAGSSGIDGGNGSGRMFIVERVHEVRAEGNLILVKGYALSGR